MAQFKVRDLLINVLGGKRGFSALCAEDSATCAGQNWSPVAVVAALEPKLDLVDSVIKTNDRAHLATLDNLAIQVGRAVVGARVATALCTQDSATCDSGQIWSPLASEYASVIRTADFELVRQQVATAAAGMNSAEAGLERAAVAGARTLVPKLEDAVAALRKKKKKKK